MTDLLMIIGMITVTWGVRLAPFIVSNLKLSPSLLNFLNCVPAAVLAALVAEPILNPVAAQGTIWAPEVLASTICVLLGIARAPMLLIVILGMASFWLLGLYL